jgi:hypothetical protein
MRWTNHPAICVTESDTPQYPGYRTDDVRAVRDDWLA